MTFSLSAGGSPEKVLEEINNQASVAKARAGEASAPVVDAVTKHITDLVGQAPADSSVSVSASVHVNVHIPNAAPAEQQDDASQGAVAGTTGTES